MGIDPGTASLGFGVIQGPEPYRALDYGCVRTAAGLPLPERLLQLHEAVSRLLQRYAPDSLAVEQLFFARNVTNAMSVGHARGVVLLAAAAQKVPVSEYTPMQVKQAISGFGRAAKQQMQRMVQAILSLPELPRPDDAADALAVALCHVSYSRFEALSRHPSAHPSSTVAP